jgi:hypothetical protein
MDGIKLSTYIHHITRRHGYIYTIFLFAMYSLDRFKTHILCDEQVGGCGDCHHFFVSVRYLIRNVNIDPGTQNTNHQKHGTTMRWLIAITDKSHKIHVSLNHVKHASKVFEERKRD